MQKADPGFSKTLSKVEAAGKLEYCFQCSSCVAECPAAQHCPEFNPREIVLASLLGVAGYLTNEDSIIWQCTTCYKCYERCPQGTHPVEVITALKNIAFDTGNAPEDVVSLRETVMGNGTLIVPSEAIEKRRDELGLPKLKPAPAGDLKKLMG